MSAEPRKPGTRAKRWAGFLVGLALLAAAAWVVLTQDGLAEPLDTLRHAPVPLLVLALLAPIANVVAVSLCFHALMRRVGRVGQGEMIELISSAWLLNNLPMRPGLIGRIGYHKSVNGIAIRDSVAATFWSLAGAAAANTALLAWALWMPGLDAPAFSVPGAFYGLVPTIAFFAAAAVTPRASRLLVRSFAYRSLDVWVWYVRYALAFRLLGADLAPHELAIISAVSQIATLIPLTGSGLGFREWGVGLSTTISGALAALGIAADLLNRAAETIVIVPIGLIATSRVAKRWKAARAASAEGDADDQP